MDKSLVTPVLWTLGGIKLLNLAAVVFSWIVRGGGRRMSSVDSVAGDPDNACRGGPVRECPVRLCRGEVSPCQSSAESARPENCRQRAKGFPWIETAPEILA